MTNSEPVEHEASSHATEENNDTIKKEPNQEQGVSKDEEDYFGDSNPYVFVKRESPVDEVSILFRPLMMLV